MTEPPSSPSQQEYHSALKPDSYTLQRLQHATPEHLHLTTRRCFIGPIPEGWLKSHKNDWYRHHLHIHYSARAATFSAAPNTGTQRRVTGLEDDPHRQQKPSFPQPETLANEHIDEEGERYVDPTEEATTNSPPAVDVPRAAIPADDVSDAISPEYLRKDRGNHVHSQTRPTEQQTPGSEYADPNDRPGAAKAIQRKETNFSSTGKSGEDSSQVVYKTQDSRGGSTTSFATAQERFDGASNSRPPPIEEEDEHTQNSNHTLQTSDSLVDKSSTNRSNSLRPASDTSLLKPVQRSAGQKGETSQSQPKGILNIRRHRSISGGKGADDQRKTSNSQPQPLASHNSTGLVKFNIPEEEHRGQLLKTRLAQHRRRDTLKRMRTGKLQDGEIIKMEKMLVRVEYTVHELQNEFDENDSMKIESRTLDKWREFMVVCREADNETADFTIQMYKSRKIPAIEKTRVEKRAVHDIPVNRKTTKVNIFSSLDKTVVLWEPYKRGNRIFIMRPRSAASSMEWYTFLRNILGWQRSSVLQVNVPDLDVSLRVDQPFDTSNVGKNLAEAARGDEGALAKAVEDEEAVASNVVERCMQMLEKSPEWGSVIDEWADPVSTRVQGLSLVETTRADTRQTPSQPKFAEPDNRHPAHHHVGLAWKRYDRLEWVHGANEKSMYGTIGMEKTHELELRPKQHYPTSVKDREKKTTILEPPAVEGFLVRLTSQTGEVQRFGKVFHKRLYFSTHNQYLVFNRPAQADPPPPPTLPMRKNSKVPTASQIADKIPLIYAVNPFPLKNGQIEWLQEGQDVSAEDTVKRDRDAFDENDRKLNVLLRCDGHIDLRDIVHIRNMQRGAMPADENVDQGPDVDWDQEVSDTTRHDGKTKEIDDDRTFEMILKNGLVVRLQAFNEETKIEWKRRLRALVRYWKLRCAADIALYRAVRRQNLDILKIDEDMESEVGQFARKWEVSQSCASPELYHMCGITFCRTVQMAGTLYRRARMHSSFQRNQVVLTHGHLLVFQDVARTRTGKQVPHIQQQRVASLDLSDCYIYSGLITDNDLLYTHTGAGGSQFDKTHPGSHHGLPRMYLEDGWSSTDEDTMTCFVVWHGKRRSWFRSEQQMQKEGSKSSKRRKVKLMSQLGKEGRSVVFKTRSRAERDHWVMSIALEIERCAKGEDVRIIGRDEKQGV